MQTPETAPALGFGTLVTVRYVSAEDREAIVLKVLRGGLVKIVLGEDYDFRQIVVPSEKLTLRKS